MKLGSPVVKAAVQFVEGRRFESHPRRKDFAGTTTQGCIDDHVFDSIISVVPPKNPMDFSESRQKNRSIFRKIDFRPKNRQKWIFQKKALDFIGFWSKNNENEIFQIHRRILRIFVRQMVLFRNLVKFTLSSVIIRRKKLKSTFVGLSVMFSRILGKTRKKKTFKKLASYIVILS